MSSSPQDLIRASCLHRFQHFAVMIQFGSFKDTRPSSFVCPFAWLFTSIVARASMDGISRQSKEGTQHTEDITKDMCAQRGRGLSSRQLPRIEIETGTGTGVGADLLGTQW